MHLLVARVFRALQMSLLFQVTERRKRFHCKAFFSGVRISRFIIYQFLFTLSLRLCKQFLSFFYCVINCSNEVECCFRKLIHFTIHDHVKAPDCFFNRNQHTFQTGKLFSHMERLRQEPLYLTCSGNGLLVFVTQLIETKYRNDILQLFIPLQNELNVVCAIVMCISNYQRSKNP